MSQDEKTVFANVDLGSLARNSENIRLQQNIEEAKCLPAVQEDSNSSSDRTNLQAIESSNFRLPGGHSTQREGNAAIFGSGSTKQRRVPVGGMLLALWLVVLCYLGGSIEFGRTMVLANLMQAFWSKPPTAANILMQNDLAMALLARHHYKDAYKRDQQLIAHASAAYGANDQRTILAKLNLALLYFNSGNEAEARKLWQAALPFLDKPAPVAPKEMTDVLLHLARKYDDNDSDAARSLYLATLNFWPNSAGSDTISNVQQDLALVDEELGRVGEANANMRRAYAAFEKKGDVAYNQFRLYHIALTYNDLEKYQDAELYAERAVKMAKRIFGDGSMSEGDALLELGVARAGLGKDKGAIDALTQAMKLLSSLHNYRHQITVWPKYYLALANSYRRSGDEIRAKQIYHDIVTELGGRESTPVVKEAARNYKQLMEKRNN